MKPLVADASFICKLYLVEGEETDLARDLAKRRARDLTAPDLLLVEAGNSVYREIRDGRMSLADGEDAVADLRLRFHDRTVPASELFDAAWKMAVTLRHPVADCVYLALAARKSRLLVTADRKFLDKTKNTRWEKFAIHLRDLA